MDQMIVPDGHVFMLGDDRRMSRDSRTIGPVSLGDESDVQHSSIGLSRDTSRTEHPLSTILSERHDGTELEFLFNCEASFEHHRTNACTRSRRSAARKWIVTWRRPGDAWRSAARVLRGSRGSKLRVCQVVNLGVRDICEEKCVKGELGISGYKRHFLPSGKNIMGALNIIFLVPRGAQCRHWNRTNDRDDQRDAVARTEDKLDFSETLRH